MTSVGKRCIIKVMTDQVKKCVFPKGEGREMKINTDFTRIAFVGTPGAGKTTVYKILKKSIVSKETRVSFITEAATLIMHDPITKELRESDPVAFQEKVSLTQFFLEDSGYYDAITSGAERCLQITDRAIEDMYVYLNKTQRKELHFPIPPIEELNKRYDAVILFELYEGGASLKAGNGLRAEKAMSDIKRVYDKSVTVYSTHPNFHRVPPFENIRDKAAHVAEIVNSVVGDTVFRVEK